MGNGAELQPVQPVSQRSMMDANQQMMDSFNEPLTVLEGSLSNIGRTANLIRAEVSLHNRMLVNTNEEADRVSARMGRVQRLMETFSKSNASNRYLTCWVLILLVVLIFLFIWVVTG